MTLAGESLKDNEIIAHRQAKNAGNLDLKNTVILLRDVVDLVLNLNVLNSVKVSGAHFPIYMV